jgi:hypothetical protein
MSQDTKTRPQKLPEKKIGPFASGIGVAIWLNEVTGEDGSVRFFRSVTINPRRYLDSKSGHWKDAATYQPSDLPALLFCLAKAQEYCYETSVPGQEEVQATGLGDDAGGRF